MHHFLLHESSFCQLFKIQEPRIYNMGQEKNASQTAHHEDDITPYTPPVPQAHRDEDQEVSSQRPLRLS